ncbi:MAG: type 2 isopentenyl-diphosphate Delta-isomerase [Candidatus Bathyarchaeota archaeon]|nr:type 2 isopentenyl-diphosphate Delta-isomerase [Candidatus Bathyarchaeota archaeon]
MSGIEERKLRHIRVSLEEDVEGDIGTGFSDVRLIHRALPELDLDDVSTETMLFGRKLAAPLIISAITGGTEEAKEINKVLASVAEEKGIGISAGSQRIAVDQPETAHTFSIIREEAPNSLVIGNVGTPQLSIGWGVDEVRTCIEMVKADAMALHMNPLQEAVQVGGDTNYSGIMVKVKEIVDEITTPIIMKETGCGIAYEEAEAFEKAGIKGLEISGLGGTSWSAVEYHIAKEVGKKDMEYLGKALWNWGIPTAVSVVETSQRTKLKIIASGGIRTGAEVAKSIVLGADAAGMAKPFLKKAIIGREQLAEYVDHIIQEFKVVMFLVGARRVDDLKTVPALVMGRTAEWLKLRGFKPEAYAQRS